MIELEGEQNLKRDSTLEEHYGVYGFQDWLKSLLVIVISWEPWIKKRDN